MAFPEIVNKLPIENEKGIDGYTLISFDAYDMDSDLNVNSFLVYINGDLAFSGPGTFSAPFNGAGSAITPKEVGGADGYNIIVDYTGEYVSNTLNSVRVYVEDLAHNSIDDTWYFRTGNKISAVTPSSYEIVLDVSFEQPLTINSAVIEPANYIFTHGMYARKAQVLSTSSVRLWVELFHTQQEFSLSVSPNVLDSYGDSIPESYNSFVFSPFSSLADLSNFNGRVRTWRDSHVVSADTNCVYLGGTKGIDVFNKKAGRWAQIFNETDQVNSMFVANFGGNYNFYEKVPPYLFDVSPAEGSIAPYNTTILFCVGDESLAVEPTALKIYINNVIAFNGESGGWANGYSGFIEIHYRYLEVAIKPTTPFAMGEEITVRVIAKDLALNTLDTRYTYSVASAPIEMIGWGFAEWGDAEFGAGS
jgi:hypothetical protein